MLKSFNSFQALTRMVLWYSLSVMITGLVVGLFILYLLTADFGTWGMAALVWVMPIQLSIMLLFLLVCVGMILALIAATKEPSAKGKAICYILCIIFLSVVGYVLLKFSHGL